VIIVPLKFPDNGNEIVGKFLASGARVIGLIATLLMRIL
jgi:hypothetical protein